MLMITSDFDVCSSTVDFFNQNNFFHYIVCKNFGKLSLKTKLNEEVSTSLHIDQKVPIWVHQICRNILALILKAISSNLTSQNFIFLFALSYKKT